MVLGMKAHLGMNSQSKLIHSVAVTTANVHVFQVLEDLLHGEETRVWGEYGLQRTERDFARTRA